jgi:SAM-dependent methyltransferase
LVPFIKKKLNPQSVVDFGCGRGAWLKVWIETGVTDVIGVDGDYVVKNELHIDAKKFQVQHLERPIDLGRKFDLVTSFEVAEHLSADKSQSFVKTLTHHSNAILFSAATVGQGGENHINERSLESWRDMFAAQGFYPYDFLRPVFEKCSSVKPWYRYNTLLYLNSEGFKRYRSVRSLNKINKSCPIPIYGDWRWKLRTFFVRMMPRYLVDWVAIRNSKIVENKFHKISFRIRSQRP